MTAYLHRAPGKTWTLTIVSRPCNGAEFQAGEKLAVAGKREAIAICKARKATPHNFQQLAPALPAVVGGQYRDQPDTTTE